MPVDLDVADYIKTMKFKNSCMNLEQQERLRALLLEFADVFALTYLHVGRTNLTEHSINTGDALPVKQILQS